MARLAWVVAVGGLYLLHQDVWFWRDVRPLAFGFLPVGLAYHAAYCLLVAVLMWSLTQYAWPAHLEHTSYSGSPAPAADKGLGR